MTSPVAAAPPLLHGVNPAAVVSALRERASPQRAGDSPRDNKKIALVIEGGGMRGVYSGGGAVALSHLGLAGTFDAVYATSAGVMNAAYFLSQQPLLGIRVYYEDLASRRFYSPLRPWKVLDVDYVFDHVVTVSKRLDVARVLASPSLMPST